MNTVSDMLLEDALDEVFHGGPAPELVERIVASSALQAAAEKVDTSPSTDRGVAKHDSPLRAVPLSDEHPLSLPRWAIRGAQGLVAAGLLALLALLIMPREAGMPAGLAAADNSEFEYDSSVEWPEVAAHSGWYVMTPGAPALVSGEHRVEDVEGQVVVKVGDVPDSAELRAMAPWFASHNIEEEVMFNAGWIKAGAFAICVIAGSAWVDNQYVAAQDKQVSERAEAKIAQLEREIKDLKAKRERVENMEEVRRPRTKEQMLERIDNAIADKEAQIKKIRERVANQGKDRDKDAERERKAREERERKAREERERKAREGADDDGRERKAREERERKAREERERKAREERERKAREERERNARKDDGRRKREANRRRRQ